MTCNHYVPNLLLSHSLTPRPVVLGVLSNVYGAFNPSCTVSEQDLVLLIFSTPVLL